MKKMFFWCALIWALLVLPAQAAGLELRGAWVSTVYNLDYPSRPGLDAAQLRQEAQEIVANAKEWGLNALFLQVRPCGDALYQSGLNPWSAFLSGVQGTAADGGFDPLDYFLQLCRQEGLSLHAWLNPYRLTRTAAESREAAFALLCQDHPARELEDCVIFHTDGCLYYDPGQPRVRQLLVDTVAEILDNYPVDGIHLDDYFYPGSGFADQAAWNAYGDGFDDIGDFRRDAVNQLVDRLHQLVAEKRPEAVFGISPMGIWATLDRMETGVATTGSQSFFDQYADSRKWVREGMVDYIMPQLYWETGALAGDFSTLLEWWEQTAADTDTALYIGLAAYRSAEAQEGSAWFGPEELQRQLDAIADSETARGAVFFRYGSLLSSGLPAGLEYAVPPSEPEALDGLLPAQWPRRLSLTAPVQNQAVESGRRLPVTCAAPRGSQVTVFYGTGFQRLCPGPNGNYTGNLSAETPYQDNSYTAPALFCAERNGVVSLRLTPYTITSVRAGQPIALEDIRWSENQGIHQVTFLTPEPCAASVKLVGDVITLDISPCRMGVLFHDEFFAGMTLEQLENKVRYRLVLPDSTQRRKASLRWTDQAITLSVEPIPPDDPEPDR